MKGYVFLDGSRKRVSDLSFHELISVIETEIDQNNHFEVPEIIAEWFYYDSRENSMVYNKLSDGFKFLRLAHNTQNNSLIEARGYFTLAMLELISEEYGEDVSALIYDCL